MIKRIETERLIIRHFIENDLNDFFLIMNDKKANEYLPWFPIETKEEAKIMLENSFLKTYQNSHGY
ncbi:MAG: GNAT family N-acetyltransferase, partial [Coprobacillus sp.]